jgi:hypothetical protein
MTCAGILTRNVEPFSQAQLDLFSSEIALSSAILGNFIRRSTQLLIIQMITFQQPKCALAYRSNFGDKSG